ncbi:MAG: carboxy terminal-processing peptidase, partial [Bacteroidota bacterium]
RNNGGGSLRDVQKMSGFFIEEGPIVQVKSRDRKPEILEDNDPRVQYDGPLIVMVNSFSASASEILAAALQDYGRAIIVGSNSTFGKGTVQRFIDLDRGLRGIADIKPLGEVKLTIQKFYRVNGGSTQLKGVVPDIILPDRYHYFEVGERENEYALGWTEIAPVKYSQSVTSLDNLQEIKAASAQRVANDETFQQILNFAKRMKDQSDETSYTLNLDEYTKDKAERDAANEAYKNVFGEIEGMKVSNLEVDMDNINMDESKIEINKEWLESIKKDHYINETLAIMKDMIGS